MCTAIEKWHDCKYDNPCSHAIIKTNIKTTSVSAELSRKKPCCHIPHSYYQVPSEDQVKQPVKLHFPFMQKISKHQINRSMSLCMSPYRERRLTFA
jgi:hypothetical protein